MGQLHKRFTNEQVSLLLEGYVQQIGWLDVWAYRCDLFWKQTGNGEIHRSPCSL